MYTCILVQDYNIKQLRKTFRRTAILKVFDTIWKSIISLLFYQMICASEVKEQEYFISPHQRGILATGLNGKQMKTLTLKISQVSPKTMSDIMLSNNYLQKHVKCSLNSFLSLSTIYKLFKCTSHNFTSLRWIPLFPSLLSLWQHTVYKISKSHTF